jgi:hypothetical protein
MTKHKALKDMTADDLRERAEQIKNLNPATFERLQSYRNVVAQLRRLGVEI